jgi:hypothetical protein
MLLSKDGPSSACSSSDEDFEVDAIIAAIDLEAIGSQFSIPSVSLQQELATPFKPLELNLAAPMTALNPNLEFHALESIEEYDQMLAKSQGFKLHITSHKNKSSGEYYHGKIDCCYKEPNCPKKNERTFTFLATFWNQV